MIFYFSQIGNLSVDSKTAKIIICQNLYKITSVKIEFIIIAVIKAVDENHARALHAHSRYEDS